ncbi:MAG: hypothetical protein U0105_26200 [Candidatus Obscuribacterales bacterium]
MDIMIWTYGAYTLMSIAITIWVAHTLSKNGLIFLVDVFGSPELAKSVNHLLVVGFYLINLGWISAVLKISEHVATAQQSIEALSGKMGFVLLTLGFMHFFNLAVFSIIRAHKSHKNDTVPPVEPDAFTEFGAV